MSDPNIYVSNGTCYTAPGEKLDGSFIPCGNDAFGHQTCCGAGDNCIADNACFGIHGSGYGSYLTYWAGCTDPDYKDATCPVKEVDQPWVALTLCDNSNGEWAICSQSGDPSTLQPGAYCSCTVASSATIAFSDSASLANICSLPQSTGDSIQFQAGYYPSSSAVSGSAAPTQGSGSTTADDSSSNAPSSAAATSGAASTGAASKGSGIASVTVFTSGGKTLTSSIASVTVFTSSGQTLTSSIAPSTNSSSSGTDSGNSGTTSSGGGAGSGLSLGTKAGIGVGAAVGGLLILLIILILFLLRRKRQKRVPSEVESGGSDSGTKPSKPGSSEEQPVSATSAAPTAAAPTVFDANGQPMAEADVQAARPWTLRSELQGSQVPSNLAGQAGAGAAAGGAQEGRVGRTGAYQAYSPLAELPGSENFAGEQGAGNTLAQEANRQLGPAWRGPSLRELNDGRGRESTNAPE